MHYYVLQRMVLQNKSRKIMLLILLRSIVWPTAPIWQCKPYQDYLWWSGLKIYCKPCIHTLPIHLKRHSDFIKLAKLMQTKGNKFLQNVKTRWIFMLSPTKRMMEKYKTLLVKMVWTVLPIEKPNWIMKTSVTSKFCLGLLASFHC